MALLLTGCGSDTEEVRAQVSAAMKASLPKNFAHLKFEERSYGSGLQPTLVYDGLRSTIIFASAPEARTQLLGGELLRMSVLAVTRSGRYFRFSYESPLHTQDVIPFLAEPCLESGCLQIRDAQSIPRHHAMQMFYDSDDFTPERFKEMFGEEAPPKRVEA